MIIEALYLTGVFIGGYFFVSTLGLKNLPALAVGYITGIALQIVIGTFIVFIGLPHKPILIIIAVFILPLVICFYDCKKNCTAITSHINKYFFSGIIVISTIVILLYVNEGFVKWSPDSLRYILFSQIINDNRIDLYTENLLTYRMFGIPIILMPAQLVNQTYFHAFFPLLGISVILTLMCVIHQAMYQYLSKKSIIFISCIGGLLLLSNNRFIINMFYIHSNLLCAAFALVITSYLWIMVHNNNLRLLAIIVVCMSASVFTRSDSIIFVLMQIMPVIMIKNISINIKRLLITALGFSITICYTFIIFQIEAWTLSSVYFYLPLGIILIIAGILFHHIYKLNIFRFIVDNLVYIVGIFLWIILIIFSIINPNILLRSLDATYRNIVHGDGLWGYSIFLLFIIITLILLIKSSKDLMIVRFPITTFIPCGLLMAYLRNGAYRIGEGDSLNRMFIQILPLMIFFIILSAKYSKYRFDKV